MKDRPTSGAPRTIEWQLNTPLLPVLGVLFSLLYAWTGYRGWLALAVGIGGAWLLAAGWAYSLSKTLTVRRSVHLAWASAGQSIPEQLEVRNGGGFPANWLEVADESENLEEPLGLVTDVARHGTRRRYPVHLFRHRGLYTLGPTRLRTGDPLGVYTLTIRDRHATHVLVTPPQLALPQLKIDAGDWGGDRRRRRAALVREISDTGTRDYMPGDSLRRIHWPASAHHDGLVVRQLEAAAAPDWWILVDLEAKAQCGSGQESTLELSIVLAASVAARGLRERRRTGLTFAGPDLSSLAPRADAAQRWRILRALAGAKAGRRSLVDLLSMPWAAHSARLIIITPSTHPEWIARIAQRAHSVPVTVLLVDPTGFGSSVDQTQVETALARARIPFTRMPRSLLRQAYPSSPQIAADRSPALAQGRRYLGSEQVAWRTMD